MSLLKKISVNKFIRLFKFDTPVDNQPLRESVGSSHEKGNELLSLERIKDLIIEAYSAGDAQRRLTLLERADRLEVQLVAIYRARGLQITADNICDTLESHRKCHCKRCS